MELEDIGGILRPIAVFNFNGTAFSVESTDKLQTLGDFLAKTNAPLNWQHTKKMIAPLISAIRRIHVDGFYHRGISPETIMVNENEQLLLTGFDIPAARTFGSEIESTLYFGYSAPEQYSSASWQGSWTDVYSLAAVCYAAITSTTPVEWRQRAQKRQLLPANLIERTVPENVSNALMTALSVDIRNRYRSVDELWTSLLHGPSDTTTVVIPTEKIEKNFKKSKSGFRRPNNTVLIMGGLALLVTLISVNLTVFIIDKFVGIPDTAPSVEIQPTPTPTPSETVEIVVPDFMDMSVERIMSEKMYTQFFKFELERVFSETKVVGTVVGQTPNAGTEVEKAGTIVVLKISMGTERETMPQVIGTPLEQAQQLLSSRDIQFVIEEMIDLDNPVGTVIASSVAYGDIVYRTKDIVTLTIVRH